MKIPKFITRGLASGALRMRPEVMEVIKKLSAGPQREPEPAPVEEQPPQPSSTPARKPPPCRSQLRAAFVSSMPGRWIRRSCLALALAALCMSVGAAETTSAFDAVNQTQAEEKPAEASRRFADIIARHGYSTPVLFNLANAQLRAGQTGQAILNYERARWLAPRDPDIAANLRLSQQGLPAPSAAAWPLRFADWFTLNAWADLGAGSLLLLASTLPLALFLPRQQSVLRLTQVLSLATLLCSLTAITARWHELNRAVVVAKTAPAKISPITIGSAMFALPEGTIVNVVRSHGPFTLVSGPNGQRGWVSRDTIEQVIQSTLKPPIMTRIE
jgi:hypothetical protein